MRELRYPAEALLVIGGPSGAGKSTLAARALDRPVLDPDDVRTELGDVAWGAALAEFERRLLDALAAGGAVVVTTAVRRGHRIGLAKHAARFGRELHLLMLDAGLELCRAGRAAQPAQRIPDGLFEHLVREWLAFRRALESGEEGAEYASVTVADRAAVDALERIVLG